jgi:hypothetical protein
MRRTNVAASTDNWFGDRSFLTYEELFIKYYYHKTASVAKDLSPAKTNSKVTRCHKRKDYIIIVGIWRWTRQQDAALASWFNQRRPRMSNRKKKVKKRLPHINGLQCRIT